MSFISEALSGGAEGVMNGVKNLISEFHISPDEKNKFQMAMETLLQKRDSEVERTLRKELDAKSQLIMAELKQDDNYTKRARPTVIYFGLFAIFWNYMLVPTVQSMKGIDITPFSLPAEFWTVWGGICGAYVLGRSYEKGGLANRATQALTGSGKNKLQELLK